VVVSVVVSADSHLFQILILFLKNFQRYIFSLATGSFEKTFVQGKAVTEQISFDHCCLACRSFPRYCRALLQSVCL
jgi:hypothetical protein